LAGEAAEYSLSCFMNKSALVETLRSSEKNQTPVKIKIFNSDKPFTGAVQKVLNQIIIVKSDSAQPVTLTFADIESVASSELTTFRNIVHNIWKTLHTRLQSTFRRRRNVAKNQIVGDITNHLH
jgi:hypothetical protein